MSTSIRTPSYSHLTEEDFNSLYSPSEDTFLLIDALEKDLVSIKELKPSLCVEIGIGSGVVLTALATVLGRDCKYIGTDINQIACLKARETGSLNGVDIDTICCDLVSSFPNDLLGKIDVLLFNPPYVQTESDEVASGCLEYTWAGGKYGREVMDRLFPQLPKLLSQKGVFYLVLEKKNKPSDVIEILQNFGFSHKIVIERKTYNESLSVVKFQRIA